MIENAVPKMRWMNPQGSPSMERVAGRAFSAYEQARLLAGRASKEELLSIEQLMAMFAGSGCDLEAVVFALQIHQLDQSMADALKQIQMVGKIRDALTAKMDQLRELKDLINAASTNDKDGKVSREELRDQLVKQLVADGTPEGEASKRAETRLNEILEQAKQCSFFLDPKSGQVIEKRGQDLGKIERDNVKSFLSMTIDTGWRISVNDIDTEIVRLQGQAQKLDSDREVKMISFQQLQNKKEQAVTQLTNLIKKSHDIQSAIINNLK
jgi:hypothetical protein